MEGLGEDWGGRKGHEVGERDIEGLGWQVETPEFGGEQVRGCLEDTENAGDV